jgi:hypothetical protein
VKNTLGRRARTARAQRLIADKDDGEKKECHTDHIDQERLANVRFLATDLIVRSDLVDELARQEWEWEDTYYGYYVIDGQTMTVEQVVEHYRHLPYAIASEDRARMIALNREIGESDPPEPTDEDWIDPLTDGERYLRRWQAREACIEREGRERLERREQRDLTT